MGNLYYNQQSMMFRFVQPLLAPNCAIVPMNSKPFRRQMAYSPVGTHSE